MTRQTQTWHEIPTGTAPADDTERPRTPAPASVSGNRARLKFR